MITNGNWSCEYTEYDLSLELVTLGQITLFIVNQIKIKYFMNMLRRLKLNTFYLYHYTYFVFHYCVVVDMCSFSVINGNILKMDHRLVSHG